MFTGIVTAVGRIEGVTPADAGVDLMIRARYRGLSLGESVAVNGACLSVTGRGRGWFRVHAVTTTLQRTLLGAYQPGRRVNLERALRPGDRLGGHFVQGHVDGVGVVTRLTEADDALLVELEVPPDVERVTVPKGSIAVDGVSMTVNALPATGAVQLSVVPWTREHTTLGAVAVGDRVHVEADVLGKYVEHLLQWRLAP